MVSRCYSSGTNVAKMTRFLVAYKGVIALLAAFLVVAYCVFSLIHPDNFGRFYDLFGVALNVILIASQVFWIRRVGALGKKLVPSKRWRRGLGAAGLIVYFLLLGNDLFTGEETFKDSGLTLRASLLEAPFKLWLLGSLLGFLLAILLWIADRVACAVSWAFKKLIIPCRLVAVINYHKPTSRAEALRGSK